MEFLPLAEEAGLMRPLTTVVLDRALGQCAAWRADGHRVTMSVNISVSNLLDDGLIDLVARALDRHRVPAEAVTLEITETTIINDFQRSKIAVDRLQEMGLGVSVDDFGAGYTSLAYLSGLAVDEMKLDRTFVSALTADAGRAIPLLRATIELGHAMGLCVVAEGIEDQATLELLAELGCDRGQGYVIGRPVAAADVALGSPALPAPATPTSLQSPASMSTQ